MSVCVLYSDQQDDWLMARKKQEKSALNWRVEFAPCRDAESHKVSWIEGYVEVMQSFLEACITKASKCGWNLYHIDHIKFIPVHELSSFTFHVLSVYGYRGLSILKETFSENNICQDSFQMHHWYRKQWFWSLQTCWIQSPANNTLDFGSLILCVCMYVCYVCIYVCVSSSVLSPFPHSNLLISKRITGNITLCTMRKIRSLAGIFLRDRNGLFFFAVSPGSPVEMACNYFLYMQYLFCIYFGV